MSSIPSSLKKKVAQRAGFRCEYCLLSESVSFYNFHADHVKSAKHGGLTAFENLAYCCPDCNYFKGSDVATYGENDAYFVRFFNPRKDNWEDHFELNQGAITGKTEIGIATEHIFKFNEPDRLIFRQQLFGLSLYP